jgi:uncharacterized protein
MDSVRSPCIKVCEMDYLTGLCRGCFRTLEQIGRWSAMSDTEKLDVMKQVEFRKRDVNG